MKLKKIFKKIPDVQFHGSREVEITGVCSNSKLVSPGNLFIAKKGKTHDGHKFIPQAMSAGCVAAVTDMYDPTLDIPQVIAENVNDLEGLISSTYYEHPSDTLFMVGLTGTNGKTTTSFILKELLDHFQGPTGLMGTIEYIIGRHRYQATHTTLDVSSNQKLLKEMVLQGCRSNIMEVTSHALDQGRVNEIDFDVAVFTNLSQDHLDYHHTMEVYAEVKSRLFSNLSAIHPKKKFPRQAIINGASPWKQVIIKHCQVPVITYGVDGFYDLRAENIRIGPKGSRFSLVYYGERIDCRIPLVGRFNIENALAAMAVLLGQGYPLEEVVAKIGQCHEVKGRLESVPNKLGLHIYVDFAHTPEALQEVLKALTTFKEGKIVTVFGCGGDRDRTKRPLMAQIAETYSDFSIVTADNCRNEDPDEILSDIMKGFRSPEHFIVELDRLSAIKKAVKMCEPKDIVLIAGRGHEKEQIFSDHTAEFDDRKMAELVCQNLC